MVDPIESPCWAAYNKYRLTADQLMDRVAKRDDPGSIHLIQEMQAAVQNVLEFDLAEGKWEEVADGITMTVCDVTIDREGQVRRAGEYFHSCFQG